MRLPSARRVRHDAQQDAEPAAAAVAAVQKLSDDVGIPKRLSEVGVKAEDIPELAAVDTPEAPPAAETPAPEAS